MTPSEVLAVYRFLPEVTLYVRSSDVTMSLLADGILSIHEMDLIRACQTDVDKIWVLLKIIMRPGRNPEVAPYDKLLRTLNRKYSTLVEKIESERKRCELSGDADFDVAQAAYQKILQGPTGADKDFKKNMFESKRVSCENYGLSCDRKTEVFDVFKAVERCKPNGCLKQFIGQSRKRHIGHSPGMFCYVTDKYESDENPEHPGGNVKTVDLYSRSKHVKKQHGDKSSGNGASDYMIVKSPGDRSDFSTQKLARFMYKLQREMGDSLDQCNWEKLEMCGQRVRMLCSDKPEVLATVTLFLGMRGIYNGSFQSCLDNCREILRLPEVGPTMATVAQTIRALACLQLAPTHNEARAEGIVACSEGEQISYLLPPCPEKARLLLAAGMTYADLYVCCPQHRTRETRDKAISAFKECMRVYSSAELTNKNQGLPRALIQFANCLVQCRISAEGQLVPQTLGNEDRYLAKSVLNKIAEIDSTSSVAIVVKMTRLNAEIDYFIDIGAHEKAFDLLQKVESLTRNTGLNSWWIRNLKLRRSYLEEHMLFKDDRETSDALLAQAQEFAP